MITFAIACGAAVLTNAFILMACIQEPPESEMEKVRRLKAQLKVMADYHPQPRASRPT
jgi:hypothetical protein